MWLDHYDIDFVEKLLAAGNETPPMTIRLNWLRVMKPDLIKNLQERGFTVEQGSAVPECASCQRKQSSGFRYVQAGTVYSAG